MRPTMSSVPAAPRVALVTGAARGIGAATVVALAAAGWRVVAVDRCADDPVLPYPLGSRAELDQVVAEATRARQTAAARWDLPADEDQSAGDDPRDVRRDRLGRLGKHEAQAAQALFCSHAIYDSFGRFRIATVPGTSVGE